MVKVSLQKDKIKFLLLEGVHQSAVDNLKAAGYTNIEYHKSALSEEELKKAIKDARFVGIRSRTQLTEDVFAAAEKLVAVGCFCIGTNQVDLDAAAKRGIPVFNAPFSNTRSVAEMVIGQLLLLLRRIPEANMQAHRGIWEKQAKGCFEARGKRLGIVGYGHIGTQLGILAEGIGMNVFFYDIENKLPLGNATQVRSLTELLNMSDVVSLHVPETASTKNMFAKEQFDLMKPGSIFINASRGTVVDIPSLADALESKHLSGAAVDVFPAEPAANKDPNDPFVSELIKFDNVILTPHIGGSTEEAQENIGLEVASKLAKYSDNGSTLSAVNFPEVSLPVHTEDTNRFLHIHENRPGILNSINQVFTENNINVVGQYLRTAGNVGYVVIDVLMQTPNQTDEALLKLKALPGTIRARLLF